MFIYFLVFLLLIIITILVYYLYKFGMLLLELESIIEASIDELEEKIEVFDKILEKPVFFDSVEVRQCIDQIRQCRDIVIKIGNELTSISKVEYENKLEEVINESKEKSSKSR
jgi:hypothetical protein